MGESNLIALPAQPCKSSAALLALQMRVSEVRETIAAWLASNFLPLNDAILLDAVFKMRGEVLFLIAARFYGEALAFGPTGRAPLFPGAVLSALRQKSHRALFRQRAMR